LNKFDLLAVETSKLLGLILFKNLRHGLP